MKALSEGVARRLGTVAAAYLVGKLGIPEELAMKLVMAATLLAGVGADVAVAALLARFK